MNDQKKQCCAECYEYYCQHPENPEFGHSRCHNPNCLCHQEEVPTPEGRNGFIGTLAPDEDNPIRIYTSPPEEQPEEWADLDKFLYTRCGELDSEEGRKIMGEIFGDSEGTYSISKKNLKSFISQQLQKARVEELEWIKRDHPQDWEIDRRLAVLNNPLK